MFHSFKVLWDHRKMLWATTLADIQSRYAGSVLGMFWLVIYPILMLTAYSVVYVFIFQVRLEQITTPQYVMLIFSGLIPFLGFSEGLGNSVISVTSNASLVKNTLYPIELIPVKAVLFSQCTEVVGLILLTVAVAVTGLLSPVAAAGSAAVELSGNLRHRRRLADLFHQRGAAGYAEPHQHHQSDADDDQPHRLHAGYDPGRPAAISPPEPPLLFYHCVSALFHLW